MTPPGPFARVVVANFFFFLNFALFFLLPLHVKALGGTETTVGVVMGSSGIASLVVLPAIGIAIDRVGPRRFFLAGTLGMAFAAFAFLWIEEIGTALFVLRLVQGVSFAAAFTAATTLAAGLAPPGRRARALGIFGVSTLLTHALAPAIGEEIIHRTGFAGLFLAAAGFAILPLVTLRGVPDRDVPDASAMPLPWGVSRIQRVVIGTMLLAGMGFGAVVTFVPTYVDAHDLGRVSFFYASYSITAIGVRLGGGGLSDTLGRRATVMPALVLLAAAVFGLAWVDHVATLALAGAVFGAAQGITYPTLHALLVDITPPAHLGRSQAMFNGSFNLGVMGAQFLFGPIADAFGHRPMFLAAALFPLLAALLLRIAGHEADAAPVSG